MEEENSLTFTKKVKNELSNYKLTSIRAKKNLLSGFTRLASTLSIGSNPSLTYRTPLSKVAKLIYQLLKELYGVTPSIIYERKMHFDKAIVYVVKIHGKEVYDILLDLKVRKSLRLTPIRALVNKENIRHFTQGLFLANGVVNSPDSKSYFLQITMDEEDDAKQLAEGLFSTNQRFSFKLIKNKRQKWMVYLKKSAEIAEFLSWLGATNSMLEYENARVTKDFFNNENRLNICYAANYSKSLKTGEKNISDINIVLKNKSISAYSEKIQSILQYRLKNKDSSYSEIAQALSVNGVKITKSFVARVFKGIAEEAEKAEKEK